MSKKLAAATFIVVVAALGATAFYLYQAPPSAPAVQDEFSTIDAWFEDLDDYLSFENQDFDYDLGEIAGDWG